DKLLIEHLRNVNLTGKQAFCSESRIRETTYAYGNGMLINNTKKMKKIIFL
ncbi:unnamed protein product, partial [Arabidopsis halleri]